MYCDSDVLVLSFILSHLSWINQDSNFCRFPKDPTCSPVVEGATPHNLSLFPEGLAFAILITTRLSSFACSFIQKVSIQKFLLNIQSLQLRVSCEVTLVPSPSVCSS